MQELVERVKEKHISVRSQRLVLLVEKHLVYVAGRVLTAIFHGPVWHKRPFIFIRKI